MVEDKIREIFFSCFYVYVYGELELEEAKNL